MFCICVISGFLRTGLLWQPGPPPNGSFDWCSHAIPIHRLILFDISGKFFVTCSV
ncbi:hypothetical protein PF010_g27183 [Phytophthora fragariae]|uniref:Uncharacterized protein n=2 Tax=Phytophthora TaxID=4783 RepID=A0A6A3W5W4_9STRA|nr:hypothetical protein PF003_g38753 [Phytophthora fragariae]KAE8952975.1 hypothetical protein PR002_g32520 [Phytophthora rubi]KAE8944780.1 hypothetical protein PF009_g5546 [Phytophthora fragariae]KAE9068135.1 hypothetical protein PF010_g27183 [Phytophthora fragariae]KAE9068669.1 hypothetical protein PF007_g27594 [Phytophthora fragariae]